MDTSSPVSRTAGSSEESDSVGLDELRAVLSRVTHDINNPLSIISGNAQLLLELAAGMGLDEEFIQPVRDIDEASRRASDMLHALNGLSQRLRPPSAEQASPGDDD